MSTDSTELTFVRCPSCRSLVPAVSTRCRMCGAALEVAAEKQESEAPEEEASGRVRQRTISKSNSELSSAADQIRDEMSDVDEVRHTQETEEIGAGVTTADDDDFVDPLGDYIDEEAVEPEPVAVAPEPVEAAPEPGAHGANGSSHGGSQPSVRIETGASRGGGLSFGKKQPPVAEPIVEEPPVADPVEASDEFDPLGAHEEQEEEAAAESEPMEERAAKTSRRSRRRRSRKRRERDVEDEVLESAPIEEDPEEEPEEDPFDLSEDEEEPRSRRRQSRRAEREEEEPAPQQPTRAERKPAASKPVKHSAVQKGRLFGWLVSYADADGEAIELREGKFFVTGSSLKPNDLVIEDESVSTPHAIVTVNVERGLELQDLMSDRGIHVRARGEDAYRREEEVVTVEHGDWVRFGDVEFLVTLIAHVGEA